MKKLQTVKALDGAASGEDIISENLPAEDSPICNEQVCNEIASSNKFSNFNDNAQKANTSDCPFVQNRSSNSVNPHSKTSKYACEAKGTGGAAIEQIKLRYKRVYEFLLQ